MWNDWADEELRNPQISLNNFDQAFNYAVKNISELLHYQLFKECYPTIVGSSVLPEQNIVGVIPGIRKTFSIKAQSRYHKVADDLKLQPLLGQLRTCKIRAAERREAFKELRKKDQTDPDVLHQMAINGPLNRLKLSPETYSSCLVREQRETLAQELEQRIASLSDEVQSLESSCHDYDQQISDSIARIKEKLLVQPISAPAPAVASENE